VFDRTSMRETSIAMVLATITGYVDAVGYTRLFGVFPANQSGNVVLFGIALGDPDWGHAWRPALAMAAFVAGVAVGVAAGRRLRPRRRMASLVAVEAVGLAVVAVLAGDLAGRTAPFGGGREVVMLGVAALVMGLQTDVIRTAARVSVSTTFLTGTLVRVADEVGGTQPRDLARSAEHRRVLAVLGAVVVMYIAGAAVGTAVADGWGGALWVPAAGAAVLAVWLTVAPGRAAPGVPGAGSVP